MGHHQFAWMLVNLLPLLHIYLGDAPMLPALMFYSDYQKSQFWLQQASLPLYAVANAVVSTRIGNGENYGLSGGASPYSITSEPYPLSPVKKTIEALLHIKVIDSREQEDNEIDSVIRYTNLLLHSDNNSLGMQQSTDNRASIVPLRWAPDFTLYRLALVSSAGVNHTYDIVHQQGCKRVLSRDGRSLIENREIISWTGNHPSIASGTGFEHPAALGSGLTTLEIPREFVSHATGKVVAESTLPVIEQLLAQSPVYFTLLISPESRNKDDQYEASFRQLLPAQSQAELAIVPDIRQRFYELTASYGTFWHMLSTKQQTVNQGLIGAMVGNGKRTEGDGAPDSSSSSDSSESSESKGSNKKRKSGTDDAKGHGNSDQPDSNGEDFSVDVALSTGQSLIEAVATKRLIYFARNTTSLFDKKVDTAFIKELSKAGLAQVIIREGASPASGIMAISKTLVKFLLSYTKAPERADWLVTLENEYDKSSYYLELDQSIYDLMLQYFNKVSELVRVRSTVLHRYVGSLNGYASSISPPLSFEPGSQYVFTGGEAVRFVTQQFKLSIMRDNLAITDDIDVLMRMGSLDGFLPFLAATIEGRSVTYDQSSFLFQFPCATVTCRFELTKFSVGGVWKEYLPTLDISFPAKSSAAVPPVSQLSTLAASLDWAFDHDHRKKDKYVDRVILLKELMPDYFGIKSAYLKGVLHPRLTAEKQKLEDELKKLSESKESFEKQIKTKSREQDEVQSELETHIQAEQTARLRLDSAEKELALAKKEINQLLEKEAEQARVIEAAREREQQQSVAHNKQLNKNNKNAKRLRKAREQVTDGEKNLAVSEQEKYRLEKLLQKYSKEIEDHKVSQDSLKAEITSLIKDLEEKSQAVQIKQSEITKLAHANKKLSESEKRLQKTVSESNDLMERMDIDVETNAEKANAFRISRNRAMGVSFVVASILALREYIQPYLRSLYDDPCERFVHGIVQEYCMRKKIEDVQTLALLGVIDGFSQHTRIPQFYNSMTLYPGYSLTRQETTNNMALTNSVKVSDSIVLIMPGRFSYITDLVVLELDQVLFAIRQALLPDDSMAFISQFASANLLLCGVMKNGEDQVKCAVSVANQLRHRLEWPCHMKPAGLTGTNICQRVITGTLTRKQTKEYRLGMLPVWQLMGNGHFRWYDTWPVAINRYWFRAINIGDQCPENVELMGLCESNEGFRLWRFFDNHWEFRSELCSVEHVIPRGKTVAFWAQSWDGMKNAFLACDQNGLMKTVW